MQPDNFEKMEISKSKSSSKAKTSSKGTKSPAASKTVKSAKTSVIRSPGDDEIRKKAQELYNERVFRGEHGSAEQDWLNAERLLRG